MANPIQMQGFIAQQQRRAAEAQANAAARGQQFRGEKAALMQAPGQFAGANANMFDSFANASAGGFGAYSQGMGQLGTSLANLYGNSMAARGQAEMARQTGLSNVGAAGLSAYGQMMGGALGAQSANASAYYKALADMGMANQQAVSQYGAGRDAALANTATSAASAGSQLGNAYSGLAGNLAASRANAAGSLGQSFGSTIAGLGDSSSRLGQATSQATGNLYGAIGGASGNVASSLGSAYGNLFGTAAGATSNYGLNSQQARSNLLASLADADLGGYSTAADYNRDMAKLGLARELGLGQLTVGSQAAASMPSVAAGIGNAVGGAMNAVGGAVGSMSGGGGGGGGFTPSPVPPAASGTDFRSSDPRFYDDPQSLPDFDPQREYSVESLEGLDRRVLDNIAARAAEGGQGIGQIGAAALSGLADMADAGADRIAQGADPAYRQIDQMRGDTRDMYSGLADATFAGIDRDAASGFGGIGQSADRTFSNIESARDAIENSPILQSLIDQDLASRNQLERGNANNLNAIMGTTAMGGAGINDIVGSSFRNMNRGMDGFNYGLDSSLYAGAADTRGVLSDLGRQYGSFSGGLSSNFSDAMSANQQLFADTIGDRREFKSPAELARDRNEARDVALEGWEERAREKARMNYEQRLRRMMGDPAYYGFTPYRQAMAERMGA